MYGHMFVCTYYVHTCVRTYIRIYEYVHTYVCVCIYICMYDHNLIIQLHKDMTAGGSSTLYQVHLTSQLTQPEVKHPQNWPAKG